MNRRLERDARRKAGIVEPPSPFESAALVRAYETVPPESMRVRVTRHGCHVIRARVRDPQGNLHTIDVRKHPALRDGWEWAPW